MRSEHSAKNGLGKARASSEPVASTKISLGSEDSALSKIAFNRQNMCTESKLIK